MDVTIAEAEAQWAQLIRRVESGESVAITRDGKPVAHLTPANSASGVVEFDKQRDSIRLLPGWDDPVDLEQFLAGGV